MKRVPPSERTKMELRNLFRDGCGEESLRTALVRLAVKQVTEEVLEGVVRDVVGRDFYARRNGAGAGYRNGYRTGRLKTSEGEVSYASPQVRDVDSGPLRSVRKHLKGRTEALEALALEMYARGCSTRDIEDLLRDSEGKSLVTRTAVSEVTQELWKEYESFATRDLSFNARQEWSGCARQKWSCSGSSSRNETSHRRPY